jgi:predicted nucleic acid-binding protein
MEKCYLDSNALLNLKLEKSVFHGEASRLFEVLVTNGLELYVSPLTLDEFIHNLIRFYPQNLSKKEKLAKTKKAFSDILSIPGLQIINPPDDIESQKKVINFMIKYGLRARDAYHLFTIKDNKIKMFLTFDSDFKEVFKDGAVKSYRDINWHPKSTPTSQTNS